MAKKYMDYERAVTMLARFGLREEDVREKVSEYTFPGGRWPSGTLSGASRVK